MYLYAANQVMAFVFESFVAVEHVYIVQLLQFTRQPVGARFQLLSVSCEAVDVELLGKVTLYSSGSFTGHITAARTYYYKSTLANYVPTSTSR